MSHEKLLTVYYFQGEHLMKTDVVKTEKYVLSVDQTKNRIYYTMLGFWRNPSDIPNLLRDWKQTLAHVTKGFTLCADLTQCQPAAQSTKPLFEQVQRMLIIAGVKKSAELFGESAIVELGAATLARHTGIPKQHFKDRQEAEVWLDR